MIDICKFYKHKRGCTCSYPYACGQQLSSDNSICTSDLYYAKGLEQEYEQLQEKYEALKLENQEGYEIVAELKHECEELKKQLETSEKWRIEAESLNEKLDLKNTCYRKALEEIWRRGGK